MSKDNQSPVRSGNSRIKQVGGTAGPRKEVGGATNVHLA